MMRAPVVLGAVLIVGCGGEIEPGATDGAAPTSGGHHDAASDATVAEDGPSSGHDAGHPEDASNDANDASDADVSDGDVPDGYHDMTNTSLWSTFDTTTVDADAKGFVGSAFDGRYVYLVPWSTGSMLGSLVTRVDTTASFTSSTSWATFDTTTVNADAQGFMGAAFDGRYLYLVPETNGVVTRYDTSVSFATKSSWTTFDTTSVNSSAGFTGATFDGRYVYFVPYASGAIADGVVVRYDTTSNFDSTASWSTFDTATVDANAVGFLGAVYDGRYVYLVPYANNNVGVDGIVARYDTTSTFTSSASWSTFDMTTVDPDAKAFFGGAFDGRYVYFVPRPSGTSTRSLVARYDTNATFGNVGAWTIFDTTAVNADSLGFIGAAFDGRYVYFVPFSAGINPSVLTRFDTLASFTDTSAWTTFDTTLLSSSARNYIGAAFDGRYLYLVPNDYAWDSVIARFDARTPPAMPALPEWFGSFL